MVVGLRRILGRSDPIAREQSSRVISLGIEKEAQKVQHLGEVLSMAVASMEPPSEGKENEKEWLDVREASRPVSEFIQGIREAAREGSMEGFQDLKELSERFFSSLQEFVLRLVQGVGGSLLDDWSNGLIDMVYERTNRRQSLGDGRKAVEEISKALHGKSQTETLRVLPSVISKVEADTVKTYVRELAEVYTVAKLAGEARQVAFTAAPDESGILKSAKFVRDAKFEAYELRL